MQHTECSCEKSGQQAHLHSGLRTITKHVMQPAAKFFSTAATSAQARANVHPLAGVKIGGALAEGW
jgi:hypothetical protein